MRVLQDHPVPRVIPGLMVQRESLAVPVEPVVPVLQGYKALLARQVFRGVWERRGRLELLVKQGRKAILGPLAARAHRERQE